MEKETFKRAEAIRLFNLDPKRVRAAAALGLPGVQSNNNVHWPTLQKSLAENAAAIDAKMAEQKSDAELKREKLSEEIEGIKLTNAKKRGEMLDPEDFYEWLAEFAAELSTKAKKIRKSLMEKCPEYRDTIEAEFDSYFATVAKQSEKGKDNAASSRE
jgi:ABC-type Zn uptake system ZnuABC Zn-binding protein ZnuA